MKTQFVLMSLTEVKVIEILIIKWIHHLIQADVSALAIQTAGVFAR
mgnify:CR=1 FL=1